MRRKFIIIFIAILAAAGHFLASYSIPGRNIEFAFLDIWFSLRNAWYQTEQNVPGEIVIVGMDEYSYRSLGIPLSEPIPRSIHAQLINRLADYGARGVAFDVLFLDPGRDPQGDLELAAAIQRLPVVLGGMVDRVDNGFGKVEQFLIPYEPFKGNAASVGLINVPISSDGYMREFPLVKNLNFPESVWNVYASLNGDKAITLSEAGVAGINSKSTSVSSCEMINYYGPAGTIRGVSESVVVNGDIPDAQAREIFAGKIVFVGQRFATGRGSSEKDAFPTPFMQRGPTFGVEIHATAAANLLQGSCLRAADMRTMDYLLGALTLLLSLLLLSLRPGRAALALLALFVMWPSLAFLSFVNFLFVLPGAILTFMVLPAVFLFSVLVNDPPFGLHGSRGKV